MEPFDRGFNAAITHMANLLFPCGFDVSFDAPQTYEELKAHLDASNRMVVWKGGSDNTIYACPEVNWCFRAWHDWCHWRGAYPFTLEGEKAAYRMQASHIIALHDDWELPRRWLHLMRAEIIGQALYHEIHGSFPSGQRAFTRAYLDHGPRYAILSAPPPRMLIAAE